MTQLTDSTEEVPASDTSGAVAPASDQKAPPASMRGMESHTIEGSHYLIYQAGRKQGQAEVFGEVASNLHAATTHYNERIKNARKLAAEDGGEPIKWEELALAFANNFGKMGEKIITQEPLARVESMQLLGRGMALKERENAPRSWVVRFFHAFRAALRAA